MTTTSQERRRLDRRTLRLVAAGLFCGSLGLAAAPASADDVCPQRGGIFRTVDLNYTSLDPSQSANPEYFISLIYDSLLDVEDDLSLTPALAAEMPEMPDDMSAVFKLREGVKFHDGTDFDAEAVKFNVERLIEGPVPSPFTGTWRAFLDKVEVVDPLTVKFTFARPWPTFLRDVADGLRFASPTAVEKLGEDYGLKGAVGTGPFMFQSFSPKKSISLTRNPDYYQEGLPCVDGFRSDLIASGSVRILTFLKGDLDVINTFPESQFPQFEGHDDVIIDEGFATSMTVLPLNTRHPALADKRVRQAIQHAVSGKEIIESVYKGAGAEIESIFPPWHPAFTKAEDLSPVRQDIEKAKALLAEAGYGPGGEKLTLSLETAPGGAHVDRGILLQAQLKEVGIDLKVTNKPMGQILTNWANGNYHMILWQMNGGPTMKDFTWDLFAGEGTSNNSAYNQEGGAQNPRVEELVNIIAKASDPAEVKDEIAELQSLVFEDVPIVYLNFRNHRTARHDYVKNFKTATLKGREDIRRVYFDKKD